MHKLSRPKSPPISCRSLNTTEDLGAPGCWPSIGHQLLRSLLLDLLLYYFGSRFLRLNCDTRILQHTQTHTNTHKRTHLPWEQRVFVRSSERFRRIWWWQLILLRATSATSPSSSPSPPFFRSQTLRGRPPGGCCPMTSPRGGSDLFVCTEFTLPIKTRLYCHRGFER